jgi:hypothetical protein
MRKRMSMSEIALLADEVPWREPEDVLNMFNAADQDWDLALRAMKQDLTVEQVNTIKKEIPLEWWLEVNEEK